MMISKTIADRGIEVGDLVVAGFGDDADMGRIGEIKDDYVVMVWWDSGVATPCDLSDDRVSVYGSSDAAREMADEEYTHRRVRGCLPPVFDRRRQDA